jgi:hypothetical protein
MTPRHTWAIRYLPLWIGVVGITQACALGNSLVGGSCAAGYVQCGEQCIEVSSDQNNCGACGHVCSGGNACVEGSCGGPDADGSADALSADDADANRDGGGDEHGNPDASGAKDAVVDVVVDAIGDAMADGGDAVADDGGDAVGDDGGDAVADDGGDAVGDDGGDAVGDDSGNVDALPPLVCDNGLTACGSQCVDLTNDPAHCGGCTTVCSSQICENSACVGIATGGIVFIGHDYDSTDPYTAQARVLSNAVFIPRANPLRVLSFEEYANPSAVAHASAILEDVAQQVGRTLALTSTGDEAAVSAALSAGALDVLLIHDQPNAPSGTLASLGATWAASLTAFAQAGGVIVILDGGTGVDEMPGFVSATGLLVVGSDTLLSDGTALEVDSNTDVVGIGVLSPYAAESHSVTVDTEPNGGSVVWVVDVPNPESSPSPVVVHKGL